MRKIYFFCGVFVLSICPAFSQKWAPLPGRLDEYVNVMYADSNYLYVTGLFNMIGNEHIQGIARWNGVKWDSMGAGIDGLIKMNYCCAPNTWAITPYQNKLYVGGGFSSLGKVRANYIGTWDGTQWDSLPVQPFYTNYNGVVWALAVINNLLYMGGEFDTVAGHQCIGIAQWNGNTWKSLNFPNQAAFVSVSAICEYQGSVYAAGGFDETPNDTISNILRWDGKNWHSVGGGIKGGNDWIETMTIYNGELYVAGYFSPADGNRDNNIQRWDGTAWHPVGGGTNAEVFNLSVINGKLYAMGQFDEAGGVPASGIAEWDGTKWCGLGGTFDNSISGCAFYKDTLYVGGGFWTINSDSIVYVAKWLGGNYVDTCGNDATGINELIAKNAMVRVYPNPGNGIFTMQLSGINGPSVVEIYNVMGQKVYTGSVNSTHTEMNLSNQSNGIYLYRVITENGELVGEGKIVIQLN